MKRLLFISVIIISSLFGYSQNRTSVGIRVGNFVGVDAKHFFSNNRDFAVQLHLNQKPKSAERGELTRINPMIVYQTKLRLKARMPYDLFLFYGGGGHIGFSKRYSKPVNDVDAESSVNAIETGLGGAIGLEFNTRQLPFVIAVDFSPYYNFKDIVDDNAWLNMGVSLRFKLGVKNR